MGYLGDVQQIATHVSGKLVEGWTLEISGQYAAGADIHRTHFLYFMGRQSTWGILLEI